MSSPAAQQATSGRTSSNQPSPLAHHFEIVSLDEPVTIRLLCSQLSHSKKSALTLRNAVFRRVARSPRLQHLILGALAEHPEKVRELIIELARDAQFCRKLILFTGSMASQSSNDSRQTKN